MEKIITPAYQISGKRRKLVGYIGQLVDGETIISSMEYGSYSETETALDALAFDILSDLATEVPAEELPAFSPSTCCFCSKPHNPQYCPDMRTLLFAPDALIYPPLDVDFAPFAPEV